MLRPKENVKTTKTQQRLAGFDYLLEAPDLHFLELAHKQVGLGLGLELELELDLDLELELELEPHFSGKYSFLPRWEKQFLGLGLDLDLDLDLEAHFSGQ